MRTAIIYLRLLPYCLCILPGTQAATAASSQTLPALITPSHRASTPGLTAGVQSTGLWNRSNYTPSAYTDPNAASAMRFRHTRSKKPIQANAYTQARIAAKKPRRRQATSPSTAGLIAAILLVTASGATAGIFMPSVKVPTRSPTTPVRHYTR